MIVARQKIVLDWPDSWPAPHSARFPVDGVERLADWLDAKYLRMADWTGYDPAMRHDRQLRFEKWAHHPAEDPYVYDPNERRVRLIEVNRSGMNWLSDDEFYEYLLHELAHDFTRFDEAYCARIGVEPMSYEQYEADKERKESVDRVVEGLCDYFKLRLARLG